MAQERVCYHCLINIMSDSFANPWTAAYQAPLSMGFSRQEYWSGLPFPSPGNLPNPGIKPPSPALPGRFFTSEPPEKPRASWSWGFPGSSDGKEPACHCRRCRFNPQAWKISWRRKWHPTPVFLPGKPHGQKNLAGYSPWGCRESGSTEQLSTHVSYYM